jgi:hypothetical protein
MLDKSRFFELIENPAEKVYVFVMVTAEEAWSVLMLLD